MNYTDDKNDFNRLYSKLNAEISYINFSLEIIYRKKHINKKNLNNLFHYITEFNKMLYKWHLNKVGVFDGSKA